MEAPLRGWFILPGKEGDRTLAQQMVGLDDALALAGGKRVLDLGCAEGLISREFVHAGAAEVVGIDILDRHVEEARRQCEGLPCRFYTWHLERLHENGPAKDVLGKFNIVLALAVVHKLKNPEAGLRLAAEMSDDLVVLRLPNYPETKQGLIRSKHWGTTCDIAAVMGDCGFELVRTCDGPPGEPVQYWRRAR